MGDRATAVRGRYWFRVKEHEDLTPWIAMDHVDGEALPIFAVGFLGFDLARGTSLAEAQALVAKLNATVTASVFMLKSTRRDCTGS